MFFLNRAGRPGSIGRGIGSWTVGVNREEFKFLFIEMGPLRATRGFIFGRVDKLVGDLLSVVRVSCFAAWPAQGSASPSSCPAGRSVRARGAYAWGSKEPPQNADSILTCGALTDGPCEIDRFVWIRDMIEHSRKVRFFQLGVSEPFFRDRARRDAFIERRIGGA